MSLLILSTCHIVVLLSFYFWRAGDRMHSTHHHLFSSVSTNFWPIRPVAAMVVVKTLVLITKG